MMKKTYEKPELNVEAFDTEDVITASSPGSPSQQMTNQVGGRYENMVNLPFGV